VNTLTHFLSFFALSLDVLIAFSFHPALYSVFKAKVLLVLFFKRKAQEKKELT